MQPFQSDSWQIWPIYSSDAGAMSGTASLTFSNSATLVGSGALSGITTLTFSNSGVMTGAAPISGLASFAFLNTGTLVGAGVLAGTANQIFLNTGTLTGAGALTGTANQIFLNTGTLSGLSGNDIAGVIGLAFLNTGTLTAQGVTPVTDLPGGSSRRRKRVLRKPKIREIPEIRNEVIVHVPRETKPYLEMVLKEMEKAGFDKIQSEEEDDVLVLTFMLKRLN